jgi:hypothetical protein
VKKPKKNKKKKPKTKWCKQSGQFLFKHAIANNKTGSMWIDTYYNNELIGVLTCSITPYRDKNSNSYDLHIYELNSNGGLGKAIGKAECLGLIHNLPKSIIGVVLKGGNSSMLVSNRKVLIEKYNKSKEFKLESVLR